MAPLALGRKLGQRPDAIIGQSGLESTLREESHSSGYALAAGYYEIGKAGYEEYKASKAGTCQ
jgi:hypothetical protein